MDASKTRSHLIGSVYNYCCGITWQTSIDVAGADNFPSQRLQVMETQRADCPWRNFTVTLPVMGFV